MSVKTVGLILLGLGAMLVMGLLAGIQGVTVVHAKSSTSISSSACMTCHEDQYYLYDTGKWYCVTEAQERCVNCHAGNVSSRDKQEAHIGLIAYPLGDGGQRCQTCHAQNTETYMQNVISQTGYRTFLQTEPYVPSTPAHNPLPMSLLLSGEPPTPFWFVPAAIVAFLFWLWLVTRTSRV